MSNVVVDGSHADVTIPIDYFDEEETKAPELATLELLSKLAGDQINLEAEIAADSISLMEKQEKLKRLSQVRIPDLMETLGVSEFKLTDGSTISVKDDIKAGITEEHKPTAFKWLEENSFDGIIKTSVTAAFGKGEMEQAKKAQELLFASGYVGEINRSVHPSTLKSFVKEQLELGSSIPIDVFGVYEFKMTKIKIPKSKK